LRASEIRCANGFSQAYILITWMPTMISFMNLMRSSVLLAVRRRNIDIIFPNPAGTLITSISWRICWFYFNIDGNWRIAWFKWNHMRIHTIQFQSGSPKMILPQTLSYRNKTAKQNKQLSNIFRHIHVSHKKCLLAWICLSPFLHLFIHLSTCTNLAPTEWTFLIFYIGYFYPHFVRTRQKYWAHYMKT